MADVALLVLKILLTFFIVYSLLKFFVFFFVKYNTRRKWLDSSYKGKTSATKLSDIFLLVMVLLLLGFLFASGEMEYISFTTGLLVGMVLIQLYFHSFSEPLPPEKSPEPPVSPIKTMSYAIEANPAKA
jgi:amino acid transporter